MATGSGVGTPINFPPISGGVYDQMEELTAFQNSAISLSRYAKLIGFDECAFWGVSYEGQSEAGCGPFWTEWERQNIAYMLAEAQQEIEQVVGYPLAPTYIVGELGAEPTGNDRWLDQQRYFGRQVLRYTHLIEAGVRARTVIQANAQVNHAADPATVGPLPTDATSADEIKVYYPGSVRQIQPSQVTLSGGNVTIQIPRCRIVKPSLLNSDQPIIFERDNNFLGEVDVVREYTDSTTQAVLVRPGCANNACIGGCRECTTTACIYPLVPLSGIVDVRPATYSDGAWKVSYPCVGYTTVRLNYRAGLKNLNLQAENAILRLAHAKSPEAPCSCTHTEHLWKRDRTVPEMLTRERLNCPFGLENGAWVAWTWAKSLRQTRMGVL